MPPDSPSARVRARDAALRRTRTLIAATAAAAVALSGGLSVVAAQAFKGHTQPRKAAVKPRHVTRAARVRVPGPQSVPAIAGQPAPLQPPSSTPVPQPAAPAPAPAAPAPQVSGGS